MTEKLIMGKLNSSNVVGFWKTGDNFTPDIAPGDYAVVENKSDYDLIKIIGILETDDKYEKFIAPGAVTKKAVYYLARCQIRKDYGDTEAVTIKVGNTSYTQLRGNLYHETKD